MTEHKIFDLANSPLEGVHLIEASAGTGKTHTITGLVLRLVQETGIPIQEVLVVTFTEAAAGELKERIRSRLEGALRSLEGGGDFSGERALRVHRLRRALNDFDQAAIFTIHGFCHRVLRDHTFESGALLDMELVTDQEDFLVELVQDFWREHFYGESLLFTGYAMAQNLGPQALRKSIAQALHHRQIRILPAFEPVETEALEKNYSKSFELLRNGWQKWRSEVREILLKSGELNRKKYPLARVPAWIAEMEAFLGRGWRDVNIPQSLFRFTASSIEESVKKGEASPKHEFFHVCESFLQAQQSLTSAFQGSILALKVKLVKTLHGELARRKEERQVLYFDDLLFRVHTALEGVGGESLARALRQKFKAALIDEFQDTDSIQYDIFQRIFKHEKGTLFLIGDPKQAIYGFRGADVFAYMKASRSVASRFTLHENWRSEPNAIDGMNALFQKVRHPFVYQEIPFFPVLPAAGKKQEQLTVDGCMEPSVRIWVMEPGEDKKEKKIGKGFARKEITTAIAGEISRLLQGGRNGKIKVGDRPLRESDVAVLVRTNREASAFQEMLAHMNVHSVLQSTASLFHSEEALHMEWLLWGISNPSDTRLVKRALATPYLGLCGKDIFQLEEDERAWEAWLHKFHEYHHIWKKQGFFVMLRRFLHEEQVLPRLMAHGLGERKSTNFLHLGEVLHHASVEKKLGMFELIKWLAAQRKEEARGVEEHQLRLESDEDAVRLVTIHRSKGLEYPVVFCPFIWSPSRVDRKEQALFHDTGEDRRLTLDLGSLDLEQSFALNEKELLAENLRLFYVAVTRARSRCYVVWGLFQEGETSAPAYLFHYEPVKRNIGEAHPPSKVPSFPHDLVGHMAESLKNLSHDQLMLDLAHMRQGAAHAIAIEHMPTEKAGVLVGEDTRLLELKCRSFSGHIPRDWRISSFSSLVLGDLQKAELRDHDELGRHVGEAEGEKREGLVMGRGEEGTIFSFPKGAGAGTFMHEVFEKFPFRDTSEGNLRRLVETKLVEHGFEEGWTGVIEQMVRNVLACPLPCEGGTFALCDVPEDKRLNELEFYFPLRYLDENRLAEVLSLVLAPALDPALEGGAGTGGPVWKERLRLEPLSGFMKGFIDLVLEHEGRYYILDWKSNHLGDRHEDYSPVALKRSMDEHLYTLQYHIYTVALNRYLQTRVKHYDYETHFGGIYYLFLRGIDPKVNPLFGVFHDRPARDLVAAFCRGLTGGEG